MVYLPVYITLYSGSVHLIIIIITYKTPEYKVVTIIYSIRVSGWFLQNPGDISRVSWKVCWGDQPDGNQVSDNC